MNEEICCITIKEKRLTATNEWENDDFDILQGVCIV